MLQQGTAECYGVLGERRAEMGEKRNILRINAGAGTGKTTVVVFRVLNLITRGVMPEEILLISFTNTAADEMRERIGRYSEDMGINADISKLRVETFHSFGNSVLRDKWEELGFPIEPKVIDNISRAGIVSEMLQDCFIPGLDYRNFTMSIGNTLGALPKTEKAFRMIKDNGLKEGDSEKLIGMMDMEKETAEALFRIYPKYASSLMEKGLIEFSDMENMISDVFRKDPSYLENLGIRHLIVDEFQDTNEKEIGIIKQIRSTSCFESLMVVGDDSQSIFGFKDTTPEYMINFSETMGEETDTVTLVENFRSSKEIIEFANGVNERNSFKVEKELIPSLPEGKPVTVRGFLDAEEQMEFVVEEIKRKLEEGIKPEAIAIIARKKSALQKYEEIMKREGIDTRVAYPEKVLDNCRVRAAIGLIKAVMDPEDEMDMLRYLNCRFYGKIMEMPEDAVRSLLRDVKEELEAFRMLDDPEQKEKMEEWLKVIDSNEDEVYLHFLEVIEEKETYAEMSETALNFERYGEGETYRRRRHYPGVQLITAHSSKGLEYPIVFDDINDYEAKGMTEEETEEARRLLFVSATRAKEELYVLGTFVAYGSEKQRTYNRFLLESFEITGKKVDTASVEKRLKEKRSLKKKRERQDVIRISFMPDEKAV